LIYINDIPLQINSNAEPITFADDTSGIISNRNFIDFSTVANLVLACKTEWFSVNMTDFKLGKNIMEFVTINQP